MKNKRIKKVGLFLFLAIFTVMISSGCSCTSSMCNGQDEQNIKSQIANDQDNLKNWRNDAAQSGMKVYTEEYNNYANEKVEELYLTTTCGVSGTCSEEEIANTKAKLRTDNDPIWVTELEKLSPEDPGYIPTRTEAFQNYVNDRVNELYESHPKVCLTIEDDTDPQTGAVITAKKWKDAWKTGLLEGLIVYPISWLMSVLTNAFGANGIAQILAILITVIIIRLLMLILNFKGQLSTIKMQSIKDDISSISEKLKDPNLTQMEKQKLSMKMMDIYKKNDIHPFASMLSQFISFPIFIAVWAAMNQTLIIRKGSFLGMEFGATINSQVFSGKVTAMILFLLMIVGQVVTMKLPTWLKNRQEKKNNPYYKKPEKSSMERQMNIMMGTMIVLVIVSGFLLPAALVIYWLFGSVFSIIQTLVFNTKFVTEKLNSFANRKKKAKVVR